MTRLTLSLIALFALPVPALAAPPNACELVTAAEVNAISERKVETTQLQKAGNPSQCGYLDSRKGAVLIVSVREVQYAVKEEMNVERDNLEKIYRSKSKQIDTVGDAGFWLPVNKQLGFRKGKNIVSVIFSTPKNQNELDTSQIARLIETRIK